MMKRQTNRPGTENRPNFDRQKEDIRRELNHLDEVLYYPVSVVTRPLVRGMKRVTAYLQNKNSKSGGS